MGWFGRIFGTSEKAAANSAQTEHARAQQLMLLANECSIRNDDAAAEKYEAEAVPILAKIVLADPPAQVSGSRNLLNLCLKRPRLRSRFKDIVTQLAAIDAHWESVATLEKLCHAYAAGDGPAISHLEPEATQIGQYLLDNGGPDAMHRILDDVPNEREKDRVRALFGRIGMEKG